MKKLILSLLLGAVSTTSLLAKDDGETLVKKNNCMSCHNIVGMKDAPPFVGIANRNMRWGGGKESIKNSIKNGSSGKYRMFSNTKMPSFDKLSDEDLDTLATWVLSQSSGAGMGMGNYNYSKMRR